MGGGCQGRRPVACAQSRIRRHSHKGVPESRRSGLGRISHVERQERTVERATSNRSAISIIPTRSCWYSSLTVHVNPEHCCTSLVTVDLRYVLDLLVDAP